MKKNLITLALAALALAPLSLSAQKPTARKDVKIQCTSNSCRPSDFKACHSYVTCESASRGPKDCLKGIKLSDEQKSKLEKLREKNRKECEKQREKMDKKRKNKVEKMDKEMKKILTPEQYAIYKANKSQMKDCHHKGHRPHKHNKGHKK